MLRYERKYLVPNSAMNQLRKRLLPFVYVDENTLPTDDGHPQYTVRSIYFDSRGLDFYAEKMEGLLLRRKFRIRGYNNQEPGSKVVFEIKRKIENRIKKHRSFFKFQDAEQVLLTGNIDRYILKEKSSPVYVEDAQRFLFHIKKQNLSPSCLVVYEREAWHGKFDHGVRITFDKNIRSLHHPELASLYHENNLSLLFDNHFILEIKYYTDQMPLWARSLVQDFKLRHDALSKYTIGFDASANRKLLTY
jgi:hypothetical protein